MQIKVPGYVKTVIDTLNKNGYKAYTVGGSVRDSLLGLDPCDFDICTNARPLDVIGLFDKTVNTGIKHGTVTVIIAGKPVEVTTFRTEGNYENFRRPQSVEFVGDLTSDLSRRDFTVNALCYNETEGLIDYFGGMDDLSARILRAIGDPDARFKEDALRILRLFRFASTLGFSIEKSTFDAAIKNAALLNNISAERIEKELRRTAIGGAPESILPLISTGVLPTLVPNENILKISNLPDNENLRFFAFLNILSNDLPAALGFLKCSNAFKKYAGDLSKNISAKTKSRPDIKKLLCAMEENIFDLLEYKSAILGEDTIVAKQTAEAILKSGEPYKISQLAINGKDLENRGYKGKEISKTLLKLLDAVITDPALNTKEKLILLV